MNLPIIRSTILALCALAPSLLAQDQTSAPSADKQNIFVKKAANSTRLADTSILIEYIKLDHNTANRLLSKFAPSASDALQLHDALEELIDQNKAQLLETTWVRCKSEQRAKTESVREDVYVVSADPAESPNTVNVEDPANPTVHRTSASPTSFNTQNVGTTLEVDATVSPTNNSISLVLAPEIITRLKDRYFVRKGFEHTARGIDHKSWPTFYTIKDTTQIEVAPGKYNLLGIHTPHDDKKKRILVLLRADLISFD